MSNATINDTAGGNHTGHWTTTANKSGVYEFATGGKFVDRNIDLIIPEISNEALTGTVDATVNPVVTVGVGSKSSGKYPFTGSATINAATGGEVEFSATPGFANHSSDDPANPYKHSELIAGTVTGSATVTGSMNAAKVTVSSSATVKPNTATKNSESNVSTGTIATSKPGSGYYLGVDSSTPATTAITESTTGSTTGYLGSISAEVSASGTVTGGTTTTYIPITSSTTGSSSTAGNNVSTVAPDLSNNKYISVSEGYTPARHWTISPVTKAQAISKLGTKTPTVAASDPGAGYTANTTAAISSGGWLTLDEGYYAATKISLATLIGDNIADITATTAANYMLEGNRAYDVDGNVLLGSITNQSSHFTNDAATITSQNGTVTVPAGYYANPTTITATLDTMTLPTSANTTAGSETNKATISRSTSTQYIHIPAGYNSTAAKYTISATPNAATPSLAITDNNSNLITPAVISGDTTKYNITTSVKGKTSYGTAGYISTSGLSEATDSSAIVGQIKAGSTSGDNSGVIPAGGTFTVTSGWYPSTITVTAADSGAAISREAITGSLVIDGITSGYSSADSLKNSATGLAAYITISGNGSMTSGNVYNGTANKQTKYMEVYTGTFSIV